MNRELTDKDFEIADEILDNLISNPKKSLRLYFQSKPEVKGMLGAVDPRNLLVQVNPKIETNKIIDYMKAKDSNDELGMRRLYKSANHYTKEEIDNLSKE